MVSPEMKEGSCLHCSRKMSKDLIENLSLKCQAMAMNLCLLILLHSVYKCPTSFAPM